MMHYKYPILDETSTLDEFPAVPVCPICGANMRETGWAWLSAGSMQVDKKGDSVIGKGKKPRQAYLDIGFHGIPLPFPASSDDQEEEEFLSLFIVDFIPFDGCTFTFCSIDCLRKWIDNVLSDFEIMFEEKYKRKLSKPTGSGIGGKEK